MKREANAWAREREQWWLKHPATAKAGLDTLGALLDHWIVQHASQ
jgi:hypothetical protein